MSEVTLLLSQIAGGDPGAMNLLFPLIYDELRRRARAQMRRERADHTLQPTALVHEAFFRLVGTDVVAFQNRAHFYSAAAEAMRRILVDHARARISTKRGRGRQRVELGEVNLALNAADPPDYALLDAALEKLKCVDERRYRVVILRYFAGLTESEVAEQMEVSLRTVKRDWAAAKLFLLAQMPEGSGSQ